MARQFPSDSQLAFLVTSVDAAPRIADLEPERARVVEAIEATTCSSRPADFTTAMRQAALEKREIVRENVRHREQELARCVGIIHQRTDAVLAKVKPVRERAYDLDLQPEPGLVLGGVAA